jgi:Tol biopolymer transport system component/predicted Ser/Thr protein kinase
MTEKHPSHSLAPGTRLGHYVIDAQVGAGGMGVVYRALDTRLGRAVAVKFLSEDLADAPARRRFQREAQMASALNHPHIVSVYDVGELEGRQYLVTEVIEGGSLTAWSRAERRSWRQILELLVGVADALAAAHAAGILHRDVKPDNVLITTNGYAKLVDFGLARLDERTAEKAQSEVLTMGWTGAGVVVGTLGYMSPEQTEGKPIDARSDIFSFGVMLYEILGGVRPFEGASHLEVLEAVARKPPPPLPGSIPIPLRFVVEKALEKDPADRYQSMRELVVDVRRLTRRTTEELATVTVAVEPARAAAVWYRSRTPWILAALCAVVGGLVGWALKEGVTGAVSTRTIQAQRLTDFVGLEEAPALSPDGRTVAFVAVGRGGKRQIQLRLLAGGAPLSLTTADVDHYGPRWSPDSSSLIYYTPAARAGEASAIWEISALGGSPRRLVEALGPGDLSHDGSRLAFFRFREGRVELVVAARDLAQVRVAATLPDGGYWNLRWSPDDRYLAYIYEAGGASFATQLVVVPVAGGEQRRVGGDYYLQGATWLQDGSGWVVSSSQGSLMSYPPTYTLWTIPFAGGAAAQLTFGESSYESPDIGIQGRLLASRVRAQSNVLKIPVTGEPADNAREAMSVTRQTGLLQTLTLDPNETAAAVLSDNGGHANVWTVRLADGDLRPVTREQDPRIVVAVPVWSPRADWINYLSTRSSGTADVTLWLARPDGSEPHDLGVFGAWACWSGDGTWLYYSVLENGVYEIRKIRIADSRIVTVRTDNAIGCDLARDGSALYYGKVLTQSTGSWDFEIRVASPEDGPSRLLGQVSGSRVPTTAVNFHALLSPDGAWLAMPLLDGATTNLWAISTVTGEWRQLTDFSDRNVMIARRIAWSRDGRHIYASVSDVDSDIVMLAGLP